MKSAIPIHSLFPMRRLPAFALVVSLLAIGAVQRATAQAGGLEWSTPVNLSRSGAADQPRIVAASDGRMQAFWWDKFDGLMTSVFSAGAWSEAEFANVASTTLGETPHILVDSNNQLHAFWLSGEAGGPLQHSQMLMGTTVWSQPTVVADSAVAYDVAVGLNGAMTLAYIRTSHIEGLPAGVYVRRFSPTEGVLQSVPVYTTIYFRLLTPEDARVGIAGTTGTLHLVWEDPRLNQVYYSQSGNAGISWSSPEVLGDTEGSETKPRILPLPGGSAIRQWETRRFSGCAMVQQTQIGTAWSDPARVWEELSSCPSSVHSWPLSSGLVISWGEGTGALSLRGWDSISSSWSAPIHLSFQFEDPELGTFVNLVQLQAFLTGGTIAVIGSDPNSGEIWATTAQTSTLEFVLAGPPAWLAPQVIADSESEVGSTTIAVEEGGRIHVVWSQAEGTEAPPTSLVYSRFDGSAWSGPVELIVGSVEEGLTREPSLLADSRGLLHMAWSGGSSGQIYYARAVAAQANVPSAWSIPGLVSQAELTGASPQLAVDSAGVLYILYVVPFNEGRGVYLVKSGDEGESWSVPITVFDAPAEDWPQVGQPTLAVAPNGRLYAAWVRSASLVGADSLGIYHAYSMDGGETWSEARELAGTGFDRPQIAATDQQVHLVFEDTGGTSAWHRWASATGQPGGELNWSLTASVPGMQDVLAPVDLAADGNGGVHLVGINAGEAELLYTFWSGDRWKPVEKVLLDPTVALTQGPQMAVMPQSDRLALSFLGVESGEETPHTKVLFTARGIEGLEVSPPIEATAPASPAVEETEAVAVEATATAEATVQFSDEPPGGSSSSLPIILGGVALLVLSVVVVYFVWARRR